MTPADELTAAADRLDALVAEASDGPWRVESHLDPLTPPRTWHLDGIERWRGLTNNVHLGEDEGTARYIAAMDPQCGAVLAEWLRDEAERQQSSPYAIRFARQINGGATTDPAAPVRDETDAAIAAHPETATVDRAAVREEIRAGLNSALCNGGHPESHTGWSPSAEVDRITDAVMALVTPVLDRDRIAATLDPAAFDETKPRSRQPAALIQWAARQHMAYQGADRLIAAGVFRSEAEVIS